MTSFSSNIPLPFPNSNDLNSGEFYGMVRTLSSLEYPTMVGQSIQIYNVQITEEWICETPPPLRLKNPRTL